MAVPYTFGSATTSIPLSQLDSNFATTITLGNTAIQLGNTVTTLNNMTLANVTISSGTSNLAATAITNGTSNVTIASSGGAIAMATNGATAITVDTSQNVGIGTTSPGAKFSLTSTGSTTADGVRLTFGSEARAHNIYSALSTGRDLTIAPYRALTINTGSGTAEGVLALNAYEYTTFGTGSSYTERMRIDSSGNVGIGTTVATNGMALARGAGVQAFLDLGGNGNSPTSLGLAVGQWTDGSAYVFQRANTAMLFGTNNTERMRITADGDLNVKRQITSFTTSGFGVFAAGNVVTVADGATITLSGGSSSQLISLTCASTGTGGAFFANYNTTVSQIGGSSTSISTTDAGSVDIAVYKSANNNTVTFKNRSGQSKVYRIAMFCGENGGTV